MCPDQDEPNIMPQEFVTSNVKYTPWTDGLAIGYRIQGLGNDYVEYLYLLPDDDVPGEGPSVSLFRGKTANPKNDHAICYFDILFEGLDYGGYIQEAFDADHDRDPQSTRIDDPQDWEEVSPEKGPQVPGTGGSLWS